MIIRNDASSKRIGFWNAENRPLTTVDSQLNIDLNFKPCFIWLLVRKRIIIINILYIRFSASKRILFGQWVGRPMTEERGKP